MHNKSAERVVFKDKSGNVRWFSKESLQQSWTPIVAPTDLAEFSTPRIGILGDGQWILWDDDPKIAGVRNTRILSDAEAVSNLLLWGCDPGPHGQHALDALAIKQSDKNERDVVFDEDSKKWVQFDPSGAERWGPVSNDRGWSAWHEMPEYFVEELLYRFPSGHWVLHATETISAVDMPSQMKISRLNDQVAAEWFLLANLDVPADIRCLVKERIFDPTEPFTPPPPVSNPYIPVWDKERRTLSIGDDVIRKVASNASSVILLFDTCQEMGWPELIDSPFPPDEKGREKRRETIESANKKLRRIRFIADGTGDQIRWEFTDDTLEPFRPIF